ncbi:hypothetical protein Scep_019841 [Stephania cephalantha]|uniref:Uncharacterized protein n=1 Tax=Stephania cephalantha TaxID=152367 RepID=A0AAP0IC17_9MAGN
MMFWKSYLYGLVGGQKLARKKERRERDGEQRAKKMEREIEFYLKFKLDGMAF